MAKKEKIAIDFDQAYETNVIGLRGIVYFAVGLFLLIVVTFGLMWFLLDVMEQEAIESKASDNPMRLSKTEALPPEPRLQAAPGFGVDDPNKGRINLELKHPQAEYEELFRQWEKLWAEGQKEPKSGTVITLPVKDAKQKFLEQNAGTKGVESNRDTLNSSKALVSDAGAGRNSSGRIR